MIKYPSPGPLSLLRGCCFPGGYPPEASPRWRDWLANTAGSTPCFKLTSQCFRTRFCSPVCGALLMQNCIFIWSSNAALTRSRLKRLSLSIREPLCGWYASAHTVLKEKRVLVPCIWGKELHLLLTLCNFLALMPLRRVSLCRRNNNIIHRARVNL